MFREKADSTKPDSTKPDSTKADYLPTSLPTAWNLICGNL